VGAGIFVLLGLVTDMAGPAVLVSLAIGAGVALLTALSFARLSSLIPREGGAYEFAHELISPFGGFLTGFLWIFSNVVTASTVALGFAYYLSSLAGLPVIPVAFIACLAVTAINLASARESITVNNVLVIVKLAVLFFFVAVALLLLNPSNFTPFAPTGWVGVLSATSLIFFAYGGFGRISYVAEEVKDARRNVPRAILLSLAISTAIYMLVAFAALGVYDRKASAPEAFLGAAIGSAVPSAGLVVSLGALAATGSVLLVSVLGVSRVMFAMSRNKELPAWLSRISANGIPRNAVLASGLVSAALVFVGDLGLVASVSNFAMLAYYVSANYSAIRLDKRIRNRLLPMAGLLSCVALLAFLSPASIAIGALATGAGAGYYFLRVRR
jgi:APA family basic amino acid/polyamine antiporter